MKRIVLLFLLIHISFLGFSQEKELIEGLKSRFDSISEVKDLKAANLFSFTTNNKVGLIASNGSLVYEPYFESVSVYRANDVVYIKAKMPNGRMALIDTEGKVMFQPIYEDVFVTEDELVLTKFNNKYGIVTFEGLGYLYPEFDTVKVMIDEDTFFVASIGEKNMVFNTNSDVVEYFDKDTVISFVEVINTSLLPFAWIQEPTADIVRYIGGGSFYVREKDKMIILNRKGQEIENKNLSIPAENVVNFDWERVLFRAQSFVGMMNYDGLVIAEPKYQDMSVIVPDQVYAFKSNEQWGLMNKDGKELTRPQFESFSVEIYGGKEIIKTKNAQDRTALINKRGKPIMQAYYQDVEPANLSGFYNQIENAGKGIISEKGVMYVRPEYDNVDAYIEVDTFFVAKRNNRYTIFGTKGDVIYDGLNIIVDIQDSTLIFVENNQLKKTTIRNNKIMQNSKPIKVNFEEIGRVFDSLIMVKNKKGWTYADKRTFKPVTTKTFDYITP
ncbi:MAG: WG repeat-containing protein, partial [Bacilli bacterium]|nr:WG repeat-containing protein [Bacilli bacterium]